ncbi:MAG: GTPase [Actinomycetota bacterium]
MRDRLIGLLEKADLALGSAAGVIETQTLEPLIESVKAVRTRLSYPEDVLVAALAGGTGSGKSSLFNALCEAELVDVGGVRPTTSRPAAAVPVAAGAAMDGYLDRLGVEERHTHLGARICLLDLPDTDSVEVEHRHQVASLLPLVDIVVWVTDPEKYRDARLHDEFLKPLSDYEDQFLFVLNQVDRLTGDETDDVRDDLITALAEDGFTASRVITTSAAPPSGPPVGLEDLAAALEQKGADRGTLYGKLLTDLAATCRALEDKAGAGHDFDRRAADTVDRAAAELAGGKPTEAIEVLTDFLEALAAEAGGETAGKLTGIAADVPDHVRRIEGQLGSEPVPAGWLRRLFSREGRRADTARVDRARALLDEAVIRPARTVLAKRALSVASIAELAVEVESLRPARERPE